MRYVDITTQRRSRRRSGRSRSLYALGAIVILLLAVYFLPIFSIFKNLLKSPTVLSFIRDPGQELASTDDRTNILLLGIDKRSNVPYSYKLGNGEVKRNGFLSDTLIVASIDFKTKQVSMLSLPRDLWVKIPGWTSGKSLNGGSVEVKSQYAKVNSAYSIGEAFNYPGGGEQLAKATISQNLDIPIHYVVRTDFQGFVRAVDVVGGIDVEIDNTFDDYMYPREGYEDAYPYESRFEHLHFDKGPAHMDGETALRYVRSRQGTNGEGSDFARARRQQKALLALRQKALSVQTLTDTSKLSSLIDSFSESISFDIPLGGFPKLYDLAKNIDPSTVRNQVLDNTDQENILVNPPLDQYGGAWVLVPRNNDWEIVQNFVKVYFGIIAPSPTPASSSAKTSTKAAN